MSIKDTTFISAIELMTGQLLVAAQNNTVDIVDAPHSLVKQLSNDGTWSEPGHLPWTTSSATYLPNKDAIIMISSIGKILEYGLNGHNLYVLDESLKAEYIDIRFIRNLSGTTYCGGVDNVLYKCDSGRWSRVPILENSNDSDIDSLENICSISDTELYGFGWNGAILTNAFGEWTKIPSPTNVILTDGDVLNDIVYIGGQVGMIVTGRFNDWSVVENDVLKQDIWSVRAFGDAVYFSCMSGILRLKGDELTLVKQLGPDMRTAMSLFVGPSGLWSVGASDIVLFDGDQWHTIAQSD